MNPRIRALEPPYETETADALARMMPEGVPPILLFRTFVKNPAMTTAMRGWGGYELSASLSISLRQRELLIDRTCALCGCEYEWGVHVAFFGDAAALSRDQIASLTHGSAADPCWVAAADRLLIEAADSLHNASSFDDELYGRLADEFSEAQLLDVMMLCGWYHAISYAANGARVDLEPGSPRFADFSGSAEHADK